MRQQARGTAAGGPRLRRRVLRLVLGVGALVAVWWFLTTGTAHAAESPVPRPVKALQEKAKPVADAKARVKTRVVAPAQAEVSRAVERTDRTADRAVSQVEKTVQKVANDHGPRRRPDREQGEADRGQGDADRQGDRLARHGVEPRS